MQLLTMVKSDLGKYVHDIQTYKIRGLVSAHSLPYTWLNSSLSKVGEWRKRRGQQRGVAALPNKVYIHKARIALLMYEQHANRL